MAFFYPKLRTLLYTIEEKMLAYLEQYGNQFLYQKAGFILGTQRRVGTEPLASEAVKIALALGTSVEYIVTGSDASGGCLVANEM